MPHCGTIPESLTLLTQIIFDLLIELFLTRFATNLLRLSYISMAMSEYVRGKWGIVEFVKAFNWLKS